VARRAQTHNAPPEADQRRAVEKQSVRAEFARRLSRQLTIKGWTQSELAARAQKKAPKGLRIGSDSISHYINGRYLPSPTHLKVLAETIGVDPLELLPAKGIPEAGESLPPIGVQDMNDGTAWLKINQAVPWAIAVKVLELLRGGKD